MCDKTIAYSNYLRYIFAFVIKLNRMQYLQIINVNSKARHFNTSYLVNKTNVILSS